MKELEKFLFEDAKNENVKRENANINGDSSMGKMLHIGSHFSNQFANKKMLTPKMTKGHTEGDFHIHDKDFLAIGTLTCCQIDLGRLFEKGFNTGHGFIRPPKRIGSRASLAAIILQSNQNDQHGGQAVNAFDYYMADGVLYSYKKNIQKNTIKLLEYELDEDFKIDDKKLNLEDYKLTDLTEDKRILDFFTILTPQSIKETSEYWSKFTTYLMSIFGLDKKAALHLSAKVKKDTYKETEAETYQAMEALVHNLNTMHSRAGAQVPFTSLNFGTCTTHEGRMVTRNLLLAQYAGLGNGETPIFPILIFKVKEGINFNVEDVNYDLFKLACKVSAKRLFPTFAFMDAPFNAQYYKEGNFHTEVAYMGCRTRTISNINGEEIVTSRGNISFTTINLPRLGILYGKDEKVFFKELDKQIKLVIKQLLKRYDFQKTLKVKNFPFLMGQGIWMDSDKLKPEDTLEDVIKHGSLSVGFIGLAETLIAMTGKHHGESEEAQKLGLKIIGHMKKRMLQATEKYHLNFAVLATPAEGLSGRFLKLDRKKFGVIKGVTDKDFYTNSFHIPVDYKLSVSKKLELEAPYHALTDGGHISYIELDGDVSKNPDTIEKVVRLMRKHNIGYGAINFKVDQCLNCGYYGIIDNECPHCKSLKIKRIRRVTGYLSDLTKFCDGKRAEEKARVTHVFNASSIDTDTRTYKFVSEK